MVVTVAWAAEAASAMVATGVTAAQLMAASAVTEPLADLHLALAAMEVQVVKQQ